MTVHDRDAPAFALMLTCTDGPASQRREAVADAAERLQGDWDGFIVLLQRHHVILPARHALCAAEITYPQVLDQLAFEQQTRALRLCARSLQLIELLEAEGIDAALLKGPLLSDQIFGDPGARHCKDIDILVDWQAFTCAIAVLERHGLHLDTPPPATGSWRIEMWRTLAKDVTLVDRQSGFQVELHHRVLSPINLLPSLGLTDAREHRRLADRDLRVFAHEDLFVYLCVHGATSLWHRLKWLVDIHALIDGLDPAGIERLQAHSKTMGTERCTALALRLVSDLWQRDLPPSLVALLESDPALRSLMAASRQRLLGEERASASFANSWARRHLIRLRKDGAYRRAHWLELMYDRELLEQYTIGKRLRWLYLPLRVLLFAKRKLQLR